VVVLSIHSSHHPSQKFFILEEENEEQEKDDDSWRWQQFIHTSSDPAAATTAEGEHQKAERAGTIGGAAVVHRLWSFEPASCWKTILQTLGLIKERLNEKIFFLEKLFHRITSFFSNFFFGHESKRHLQVELLHAEQLQKKEKQQQHATMVHDDLMIKHLHQDDRIISHDHHVPAGPACTTLRQKLASIVTKIVLEGMMESTHKTQSIHALKKNLKYMVGVHRTPQEQADKTPRSRKWSWKMQGRRCSTKGATHPTVVVHASSVPHSGLSLKT